jgi:hypothetical protein
MKCVDKIIYEIKANCIVTIFYIIALAVFISQPAGAAEQSGDNTQTEQAKDADKPLIEFGRFAPDFELPTLTFKTDPTGKTIGLISEENKIRLSSFRGKKPVCLIMSSYT